MAKKDMNETRKLTNLDRAEVFRRFQMEKNLELIKQLQEQNQLSKNTREMLKNVGRIQNKGRVDDSRVQRIRRERQIIQDSTSLLRTPNIFNHAILDFTGIPEDNILMAENIFKHDKLKNPSILEPREHTILDTKKSNNTLRFFGSDY